ncbi:hypothetical protein ACOMHN_026008 [Nucella lapillus]
MAPDSLTDIAGPVQLIASMTITSPGSPNLPAARSLSEPDDIRVLTTSPLPSGILYKGRTMRKSVSFRDELVHVREIPPRFFSGDEESEDEGVASSSDSEEATESESEEEAASPSPQPPAPAVVVNRTEKLVSTSVTRTTPIVTLSVSRATPPASVTQTVSRTPSATHVSTLTMRPERAPIPWTPVSSFTGPKGSYAVTPATKVVSLVSRITGASPSATQAHIKQRSAAASTSSSSSSLSTSSTSSTRKAPSPVPPKKPASASAVRVEKKVKKISPILDNVMTSQTVRSAQKHGAVSETLHKGSSNSSKTGKKKRSSRRQEANDKRKATPTKKSKDSKQSSSNSKVSQHSGGSSKQTQASAKRNVSSAGGTRPRSAANGFGSVRDSLSLPPLSRDDSALLNPGKLQQHQGPARTPVYSMRGFVFPGDPTHDITTSLKATADSADDVMLKSPYPPAGSGYPGGRDQSPGRTVRDRVSSAPADNISRRKRFYAWQMANGNLQNSLYQPPSITPMWESVPAAPTPKPAYVTADR